MKALNKNKILNGEIMNEIIEHLRYIKEHLKCVKEHQKWIKTEYIPVDLDIKALELCIIQLERINNKPSEDEIIGKLEKASWKSYSDVAKRSLLWLDDAIKIVRNK